jgi:lipopolysaccharide export system permease protein
MAKELFVPFIFSLLVIIFVLFVQFLLRAVDRFLGKGLDVLTILEYLFLNLAWIVALAVPMAVLIATLMSFGRLSEDNEITAMRTSGISFLTIIRPALIFGLVICLALIYFNNFVLPEMNFHARMLSGDIYRKRPDMQIDPGRRCHVRCPYLQQDRWEYPDQHLFPVRDTHHHLQCPSPDSL